MNENERVEKPKNEIWKKIISIVFRCAFFAFILWFVFHKHYKEIYENISGMNLGVLAFILFLGASYQLLGGVAFYYLTHKKHPNFTIGQSLESVYVSYFGTIAAFSVGAIPLRMYYLHRHNIDAGNAIGLINSDYILHKSAVLLCNTGLLLIVGRNFIKEQPYILKYILYGYLVCLVIITVLVLVGFSEKVFHLAEKGISKIPEKKKWKTIKEKLLYYLNTMHECGVEMKKNTGNNFRILFIHCVKLLVMYSVPYVCMKSMLNNNIAFWEMVMLVGVSNLVSSALPNVSGLGSTELAFMLVFSKFLEGSVVSSTLVLYRFATYFFPFVISCIVFASVQRKYKKGKK